MARRCIPCRHPRLKFHPGTVTAAEGERNGEYRRDSLPIALQHFAFIARARKERVDNYVATAFAEAAEKILVLSRSAVEPSAARANASSRL